MDPGARVLVPFGWPVCRRVGVLPGVIGLALLLAVTLGDRTALAGRGLALLPSVSMETMPSTIGDWLAEAPPAKPPAKKKKKPAAKKKAPSPKSGGLTPSAAPAKGAPPGETPVGVMGPTPIDGPPLAVWMDDLYSTRIPLDAEGVPLVHVGLSDDRDFVRLRGDRPVTLTVFPLPLPSGGGGVSGSGGDLPPEETGEWGKLRPHRITIPAGVGFRIRRLAGRAATMRHLPIVEEIPVDDRATLAQRLAEWKARGLAVKPLRAGSVQGMGERLVNTKRYFLAVGAFEDRSAAQAEVDRLARAFDIEPEIHEELLTRPAVRLRVEMEGGGPGADGGVVLDAGADLVWVAVGAGGLLEAAEVKLNDGFWKGPAEDRRYRGDLYVTADRGGRLLLGNRVDIETLLRGTVPSETIMSAGAAAIEAQAVAARNEVLSKLGTHYLADAYQLCSTQRCQVYAGIKNEHPKADAAVRASRGEFMFIGERLVNARYSAHAGGFTENNENVWTMAPDAALRGRFDGAPEDGVPYRNGITEDNLRRFLTDPPKIHADATTINRNKSRWRKTLSADEVTRLVAARFPQVGRVRALVAELRGVSGRIIRLRVVGQGGEAIIVRELPIRRLLGGLSSALFVVDTEGPPEAPEAFTLIGAGWGHGVGMCQTGAMGMAALGFDHGAILRHYYRGAEVVRLYGGAKPR